MTSEQQTRHKAISKTVSDAMKARTDCDWSMSGAAIDRAMGKLDEAMHAYIFENGTRDQVRSAYKRYADLHKRTS